MNPNQIQDRIAKSRREVIKGKISKMKLNIKRVLIHLY